MFRDQSLDLSSYEQLTFSELNAAADLVSALYAKMSEPDEFTLLSLLYFAAMSYSETAWRLGKTELASGFLLTNDETFSSARSRICREARAGGRISAEAVTEAIEPYDIAGLTDWKRDNWYLVDFSDLRKNAHKLGADEASFENLFQRLGLDSDRAKCLQPEVPILP
jgi:tetracycline 7-halogenase / FADH2 O2-dependent halogenase